MLILRRAKRKWETKNIPLHGTLLSDIFQIRKIPKCLRLGAFTNQKKPHTLKFLPSKKGRLSGVR
jgi:hypothetical protein